MYSLLEIPMIEDNLEYSNISVISTNISKLRHKELHPNTKEWCLLGTLPITNRGSFKTQTM